jgi:hypothetical protein
MADVCALPDTKKAVDVLVKGEDLSQSIRTLNSLGMEFLIHSETEPSRRIDAKAEVNSLRSLGPIWLVVRSRDVPTIEKLVSKGEVLTIKFGASGLLTTMDCKQVLTGP